MTEHEDGWDEGKRELGPSMTSEEKLAQSREELERSLALAEGKQAVIDRMVSDYGRDERKAQKFMDLWPREARRRGLTEERYWSEIWHVILPIPLGERQARATPRRKG